MSSVSEAQTSVSRRGQWRIGWRDLIVLAAIAYVLAFLLSPADPASHALYTAVLFAGNLAAFA